MKNIIVALLALGGIASAHAEEAKPADETTINLALTSDYRYRGISQTRLGPALQAGAEYIDNQSGFYLGMWGTNIRWTRDAGGSGGIELDLYAGRRGTLGKLSYDAGLLTYVYPGNGLANVKGSANANTTEIYGQLGLGAGYVKYSHAVTNTFGFADSKNSGYLDLGYNPEWRGNTINLHVGRQRISHTAGASYTDWKIGVTRDFGIVIGALALVGTDAERAAYTAPGGKFNGRTALVGTVSKNF
jgi:uncharacterized protein (TIGR02001 family)